jgi:hypothetical protein
MARDEKYLHAVAVTVASRSRHGHIHRILNELEKMGDEVVFRHSPAGGNLVGEVFHA